MTKPLYVGNAARSGLLAAKLAQRGFTANTENVFEHKQGFLDVFNGSGTYDTARALQAWARPLDIIAPGIAIKQYPCCGATHPAIDAMLDIVQRHRPRADQVARIDVAIHSRRLAHTNRRNPKSELDAKFSLQYVMVRALLDGRIGLSDFENEAYLEPHVQALIGRVSVAAYDETGVGDFPADKHFGAVNSVTLTDGAVLHARVEQPLGRTPENPLQPERLREKFMLCARTAIRKDATEKIARTIEGIPALQSMRTLTSLIEAAAR